MERREEGGRIRGRVRRCSLGGGGKGRGKRRRDEVDGFRHVGRNRGHPFPAVDAALLMRCLRIIHRAVPSHPPILEDDVRRGGGGGSHDKGFRH